MTNCHVRNALQQILTGVMLLNRRCESEAAGRHRQADPRLYWQLSAQAGDREGGLKNCLSLAAKQRSVEPSVASGEPNDDETDPGNSDLQFCLAIGLASDLMAAMDSFINNHFTYTPAMLAKQILF